MYSSVVPLSLTTMILRNFLDLTQGKKSTFDAFISHSDEVAVAPHATGCSPCTQAAHAYPTQSTGVGATLDVHGDSVVLHLTHLWGTTDERCLTLSKRATPPDHIVIQSYHTQPFAVAPLGWARQLPSSMSHLHHQSIGA